MKITSVMWWVVVIVLATIGLYEVTPNYLLRIKLEKVAVISNNEDRIFDAIWHYQVVKKMWPNSMADLTTNNFYPTSSNNNGFGGVYGFDVNISTGIVNIYTNIQDAQARSAYVGWYKNTFKPVDLNDANGTVKTTYVISTAILHGNGQFMSGIPVQPTPPASSSVYWYDTSSAYTQLRMYDNGTATWKIVSNPTQITSDGNVTTLAQLPLTGNNNGDVRNIYDSTTNTIQQYTWYAGSNAWIQSGSVNTGSTTTASGGTSTTSGFTGPTDPNSTGIPSGPVIPW